MVKDPPASAGDTFLKKFSIYFNWRLVTLQYCSGFAMRDMYQPQVYMRPPS